MQLDAALETLRSNRQQLEALGVQHAAIFGSVARGQSTPDSDVDVLLDLDPAHPIGVFQYARLKLFLAALLPAPADIVHRKTLKPLLRDNILRDAIYAF